MKAVATSSQKIELIYHLVCDMGPNRDSQKCFQSFLARKWKPQSSLEVIAKVCYKIQMRTLNLPILTKTDSTSDANHVFEL
ncbi:hypothetical protein L596_003655 [Steinernema carpocapsae]|uniref:Uncharacterized protein n=1 Tax=Steinernema carpocapsae TaxID=34508 RepID=A0A4U8UXA1_STECR|nr:hypothetical protein L596_003655 [Steinernema carpocapsae]